MRPIITMGCGTPSTHRQLLVSVVTLCIKGQSAVVECIMCFLLRCQMRVCSDCPHQVLRPEWIVSHLRLHSQTEPESGFKMKGRSEDPQQLWYQWALLSPPLVASLLIETRTMTWGCLADTCALISNTPPPQCGAVLCVLLLFFFKVQQITTWFVFIDAVKLLAC